MKNLIFSVNINAPKQKVWETMLDPQLYQEWTGLAWPGSYYTGQWAPGANISFIGADGSGTLAHLCSYEPFHKIAAEHIAVLLPGGIEDRDSETAKTWVGSTERYDFSETNGVTNLTVTMGVNPEWEAMFNNDWPKALAGLKALCEKLS